MAGNSAPAVLIVEDAQTTNEIVALTFRNAGFATIQVRSVQEAIAHVRQLLPQLVITDRGLPDASGFSVCRFLRSDPAYAGVKIIMVSGDEEAKHDPENFPGAYDLFLAKPFSLRELLRRGREFVGSDGV